MATVNIDPRMKLVTCSVDICEAGAPREILLVPWGRVDRIDGGAFTIDEAAAERIASAFRAKGTDIPIDYEHQSLGGAHASRDGTAPAAGWIKSLHAAPGEGVFARVEWTPRGAGLIQGREYRYLSPVLDVGADGCVSRLHSAALTNQPAIVGFPAIVNSARMAGGVSTDSGNARRTSIIATAAREYDGQSKAYRVCSKEAWCSEALREAGLIALTDSERSNFAAITEDQNRRGEIIKSAMSEWESAGGRLKQICSQGAYVNQALRDAGLSTITDDEHAKYGIRSDPLC